MKIIKIHGINIKSKVDCEFTLEELLFIKGILMQSKDISESIHRSNIFSGKETNEQLKNIFRSLYEGITWSEILPMVDKIKGKIL